MDSKIAQISTFHGVGALHHGEILPAELAVTDFSGQQAVEGRSCKDSEAKVRSAWFDIAVIAGGYLIALTAGSLVIGFASYQVLETVEAMYTQVVYP